MAMVPGYDYDIFISYAHVDNLEISGQKNGWIEEFYNSLNLLMIKRYGRMDVIKIWWDNKKLDGSILFDQSIETGIKRSAIMICLQSPGYTQSQYCKQELDTFYKKASEEKVGLSIGDRSRIINVLLNNIPYKQWPPELSGTSGFPFHDAKEATDFGDTLDPTSTEFRTQLQNVRDAVWNILENFPKETPGIINEPAAELQQDTDSFKIFIGEVPDTLRTSRKRVIAELQKKGFEVLSGVPPPEEAAAHDAAVGEALQKTNLAIHLLDAYPGREIIGAQEIWYPQQQAELSLKSDKTQMIWVPADIDLAAVEEEKYRLFLQNLESGKASAKKYEFVRGNKGNLSQEIIDFAEQQRTRQLQKKTEKGKLSVLLDTHFNDQMYALELGKALLENQIQPFINPQEDDPRKNIDYLGERLSQVRKLIFLYGSVSKEWVRERINAAMQLIINNEYSIEELFVYMAPPHKADANIFPNQKFLKVRVVDSSNYQQFDNEALKQFVVDLKTETA